jgi:hypothetical protein
LAYRIVTDAQVRAQIRALPASALPEVAEVISVLQLTPWNGSPYNPENPDSPMRQWRFAHGRGFLTYLVLDDQDRVDLLNLIWLP